MVIRPASFRGNTQTAASNAFQRPAAQSVETLQAKALAEWQVLVDQLCNAGVEVIAFDDTPQPIKPDAVYPNNWISFHADGTVVLYPMEAQNRRPERREDIVESLSRDHGFFVRRVIDLSVLEAKGVYLESTGSMVLDRVNHVVYACISSRTHPDALGDFSQQLDYEIVAFDARDDNGTAIYHTNIVMSIGDKFAVVCSEAISKVDQRRAVEARLEASGREIVQISLSQMGQSAANILELGSVHGGQVVVMSKRARQSFSDEQLGQLQAFAKPLAVDLDVIEHTGGGSARCMLAEVHLPRQASN